MPANAPAQAETATAANGAGADNPSELVIRPRLLRRLSESSERTIVLCAPSGYGKSVLLSQWADRDPRPAFTILPGPEHNDPTVLVEAIVTRLGELEPFPAEVSDALQAPSPDVERVVIPRLIAALADRRQPFVLVLDELERIEAASALEVVAALCRGMPPGCQLALASRSGPAIGLGRLRAGRRLTELGVKDLTMTKSESESLLAEVGVRLSPEQLDAIAQRTEGWPAALYLAGLALNESAELDRALRQFAGDGRGVVDYLREEFLLPVSRNHATFLRRASVLRRLSGSLCDFALERDDSAKVLDELSRANMLLVPVDRRGEWYRLHPLLQEMLEAELRRSDGAAAVTIHLRASEWWRRAGETDQAIHHALEAGAEDLAGSLLFAAVPELMTRGRNATLVGWLAQLGDQRVAASPGASLTAAWVELTLGRGARAEHWSAIARRLMNDGDGTGGDATMTVGLALVDAVLARDGLAPTRETIAEVEPLLDDESPWRSVTSLLDGVALHLLGLGDAARTRLKEAARRGSVGAPNIHVIALTQLAMIALAAGERELAEEEVALARAQIARTGIDHYPMLAFAYATSAYLRARRGTLEQANADFEAGRRLLAELDEFAPWYEAETLVMLARAAARLSRRDTAQSLLAAAERRLAEIPERSLLSSWIDDARGDSSPDRATDPGLTGAELRLLQFLPGHLSFPQIAAQIHVSPNTVKTQAASVYRKLGCRSRDEAVRRAREAGLLDATS